MAGCGMVEEVKEKRIGGRDKDVWCDAGGAGA